jgi:NMD protein affecting ribosome stability and mRNA decay
MEPWQKDLAEILETVADEVENFFQGINDMVDAFFELTEEITFEVQNNIAAEIDQYLQEFAEPLLEVYWELEDVVADVDPAFPYQVEATVEQNAACIGCSNYHGQVYGGNLLVCAMHPHGWDDESCPDWENSGTEF